MDAITVARPITERMAEAKAKMLKLSGMGVPRVYFLGAKDFGEFALTKPPTVEAMFALGGHRGTLINCLAFEGIAVRQTDKKPDKTGIVRAILYCTRGRTVSVLAQ